MIHVVIDVLLTFEQFQAVVMDPEMYLLPEDMAVLFEERLSFPLSSITVPVVKVNSWAQSIAKWNHFTHTLRAMSAAVSYLPY